MRPQRKSNPAHSSRLSFLLWRGERRREEKKRLLEISSLYKTPSLSLSLSLSTDFIFLLFRLGSSEDLGPRRSIRLDSCLVRSMGSPVKGGFLTDEQREVLMIAALNAEVMSMSPRSPTGTIGDHHPSKIGTGRASGGPRHVRRTHSGKLGRVKKGELLHKF